MDTCTCGQPVEPDWNTCPRCSFPLRTDNLTNPSAPGFHGRISLHDHDGDVYQGETINIGPQPPRLAMSRKRRFRLPAPRAILGDVVTVAALAGLVWCAVYSWHHMTWTSDHVWLPMTLIVILCLSGLYALFAHVLKNTRQIAIPYTGHSVELDDHGHAYLTRLTAPCIEEGCTGLVRLMYIEKQTRWVCRANPSQHWWPFDPTKRPTFPCPDAA